MNFASDNTGPVHPKIMQAISAANTGHATPYGNDDITTKAETALRDLFDAPNAAIQFVATGSAANALSLACFSEPWHGMFCHRTAHVQEDECGAPEFYTNGAKLILVDGADGKMNPTALETAINRAKSHGVHGVQPGPVTLTNITETGTAYTLDDMATLVDIAKSHDLPVHLDGARFANACVALGCTPADLTWRLGIDAVSFGGTKNGCMAAEAVVMFNPDKAWELALRRKRGGHLFSKHRYLAAQILAYVQDTLWLDLAHQANAVLAHLIKGLDGVSGVKILYPPAGNMVFLSLPQAAHDRAFAAGAQYYVYPDRDETGAQTCRIVCDWSQTTQAADDLLAAWAGA
jgi:threonine aldolase